MITTIEDVKMEIQTTIILHSKGVISDKKFVTMIRSLTIILCEEIMK